MSIITLTTDYGLKDYFVGAMKGKIISQHHNACIVDISHQIDPFNILEASYCIASAYKSFPEKTIHIIGVDVERTNDTKLVALLWDGHYFFAADNGILSILTKGNKTEDLVEIPLVSTKSEMDSLIFAACQLATNHELKDIGFKMPSLKEVRIPKPTISIDKNQISGVVTYMDHFGNAITNITKTEFTEVGKDRTFEIILKNNISKKIKNISKIHSKYVDIASSEKFDIKNYEGKKMAIFNESECIEIAIFRSNPNTVGSTHSLLGLNYGDSVVVQFNES
jgi:S-adenosylmethionine hydrolase